MSTPGSSVKEEIAANYAARLAGRGLVALAFDPGHQGQSGGGPRDVEDPYRRREDISYAIDTLSLVRGVDPSRIGVLGICAGGGYAVHTARTDHRLRAVGSVVTGNMGESWRSAGFSPNGPVAALDDLADARTLPRGRNERSTNRRLRRNDSVPIGYDAFHLVDQAVDRLASSYDEYLT